MKYPYSVCHDGVIYKAGEEVPVVDTNVKAETATKEEVKETKKKSKNS